MMVYSLEMKAQILGNVTTGFIRITKYLQAYLDSVGPKSIELVIFSREAESKLNLYALIRTRS